MKLLSPLTLVGIAVFLFSGSHFLAAQSLSPAVVHEEPAVDTNESTPATNPPIEIELVTVGDAGNAPDKTSYGAVNEDYQIGKYDITASQYCVFLNAVAADDPYHLYNEKMMSDLAVACIQRSGSPTNYSYSIIQDEALDRGSLPITCVSYYSALRFCNWLHNGQPNGPEGPETTETGTYMLNGKNIVVVAGENDTWRLPTEDEWYKAAYYIGGSTNAAYWKYPTQENSAPTTDSSSTNPGANYFYDPTQGATPFINVCLAGADEISITGFPTIDHIFLTPIGAFANAPGPYGTYDMGGDVFQWTSSRSAFLPWVNDQKEVVRGGCWKLPSAYLMSAYSRMIFNPNDCSDYIGFRVIGPKPPAILPPAPSNNNEVVTSTTEMLSTSAPLVTKNSASITHKLTKSQQVAIVAAIIAALILACWWLWPLLPEISAYFGEAEAEASGDGIEMVSSNGLPKYQSLRDLQPLSRKPGKFMRWCENFIAQIS